MTSTSRREVVTFLSAAMVFDTERGGEHDIASMKAVASALYF